ncbi:MAG: Fic family protein [Nitriliruptoraceae bacterium]|nr:Fic family protein [Nitriliruptoraceae bacterium]
MALSTTPPTFSRSPHLVGLVAEVERLAAAIGRAPTEARRELRTRRADDAARATLVLDGATTDELPDADAAAAVLAELTGRDREVVRDAPARATWLDTLRVLDDPDDHEVSALEVLGVRAADESDDLAEPLLTSPGDTLAELHRRLTRGLVTAARAGQPRTSEQAVHDGATGRIVYFTTDPAQVPGELALLDAWLASTGAREHGLIASGVLHVELLRIHPFDAANGRLARAAARLALRARGLDPDRLAVPEPALARDPLGYAEEVARTARRRDQTIWLERWGEAVAEGLRHAARALGTLEGEVPDAARRFVETTPTFTIADHRAARSLGAEDARAELERLLDAGLVWRVAGSRGLRFLAASDA